MEGIRRIPWSSAAYVGLSLQASRRHARVAACYLGLATAFTGLAITTKGVGYIFFYHAVSCVLVAVSYGMGRTLLSKSCGGYSAYSWILFAPYLAGNWCTWRYYTTRVTAFQEILPHVFVGRRLFRREARALTARGITAVLDLAPELLETPALTSLNYCHQPMLDLVPPSRESLLAAVAFIEANVRRTKVYIHCKLGLSRSAAVVAAYLIKNGYTMSGALALIEKARPGLVICQDTKETLRSLEACNASDLAVGTSMYRLHTLDQIARDDRDYRSDIPKQEETTC